MLLIGLLVTFLLGFSVVQLLLKKPTILEVFGLSVIIGLGIQTFVMFLLNFAGMNISSNSTLIISAVLILLFLGLYFWQYKTIPGAATFENFSFTANFGVPNLVWLICIGFTAFIIYAVSLKALFWPTYATDAITSFDIYAKAIAHEGKLINSLIYEHRVGPGVAYPPLYTLGVAYFYQLGFENANVISVVFLVGFAVSFYALFLRISNSTSAAFFTLMVVSIPEFLAQSAVNITSGPQAVYSSLAVVSFFVWIKNKENKGYFLLSAVLLACSGFIRSEDILYMAPLFLLVVYYIFATKELSIIDGVKYITISFLPFFLWQLFLKVNIAIMDKYVQVEMMGSPNFAQWGKVWDLGYNTIMSTQYYGATVYLFLIVILASIAAFVIKKDKLSIWSVAIVIMVFLGYLVLVNQMKLREDTIDNIVSFSGKRFFFGVTILMWVAIATNYFVAAAFEKIHSLISKPEQK